MSNSNVPALPEAAGPMSIQKGFLVQKALSTLRPFFVSKHHSPSPEMWDSLIDLLQSLEDMAHGVAPSKLMLSSLDPGVGKTQTIGHFLKALLSCPEEYGHVGVLILVARLEEIRKIVSECVIPENILHVATSDDSINDLGKAEGNSAQVFITTQQRLEKVLSGGDFSSTSCFFYRDKPRAVRVWDETFLPGKTVTLCVNDIGRLFTPTGKLSPTLGECVQQIFFDAKSAPDGSRYEVPDLDAIPDASLNELLRILEDGEHGKNQGDREDTRRAAEALWNLSGRTVNVRKDDNRNKNTILSFDITIPPAGISPLVITDASGRCRETYPDLARQGQLLRLRSAPKLYDPLSVYVWNRGGGKSGFKRHGEEYHTAIANVINARPDENILVVGHKPSPHVGNTKKEVCKRMVGNRTGRVEFINWGSHVATNDYADCTTVILAGTLFYRPSQLEALKRLSANRPATVGDVTKVELRRMELGESMHGILQALCRGSVRKCDGSRCHPMSAYIIASVRSEIPEAIPDLFPGCVVKAWNPSTKPLPPLAKAVFDYLKEWRESGQAEMLKFATVSKSLRISRSNFKSKVRDNPLFQQAVAAMGIVEWGRGSRNTAFRSLVSASAFAQ